MSNLIRIDKKDIDALDEMQKIYPNKTRYELVKILTLKRHQSNAILAYDVQEIERKIKFHLEPYLQNGEIDDFVRALKFPVVMRRVVVPESNEEKQKITDTLEKKIIEFIEETRQGDE